MTQNWYAVDVEVEPHCVEAAEFAFNTLDALGTEIDHLRRTSEATVKVTAYFNDLPDETAVSEAFRSSFHVYGLADLLPLIATREVEDADWLAEWKRHWKPTTVANFVIAPPWSEVTDTERIVIRIEPNMAFGTGTHATTQLCLQAMSSAYQPEMSLLDVGTGTGILAIAAAKLGGRGILACDTDADSVKIARENATLNGVAEFITFIDGPIDERTPQHDFVCANLTIDVIVPILPLLLEKAAKELLLSGILVEQESEIRAALAASQISAFNIETSGEWISVLIER